MVAQQEPLAQDKVELTLVDLAVLQAEREHDDVEQVAHLLELGPLVAFGDVFGQERVQGQEPRYPVLQPLVRP